MAEEPAAVPSALASGARLVRVARGLKRPVGLEHIPGDDSGNLYVVEQGGWIRLFDGKRVHPQAIVDLSDQVSTAHNEQGLLGLAFHPRFKEHPRLYVNYTDRKGATRVVEYRASLSRAGTLRVDQESGRLLLKVGQPYGNHNGGYLEFGSDEKLYVGLGDGGAANDPHRVAQKTQKRLGKMLRIDVGDASVERVQRGLRNPWRFHFDRNGDLYIADVGQNKWEEVNVVTARDVEGANFGWSLREGKHCFRKNRCRTRGLVEPVVEYGRDVGCSITGGVVYRGKKLRRLRGMYFYSDYCTAILRSFRWKAGRLSEHFDWKKALDPEYRLANVAAFGVDREGEMYILANQSSIFKLVATEP